jgi:hypothetical protein
VRLESHSALHERLSGWGVYKTLPDSRIAVFDVARLPPDTVLLNAVASSARIAAEARRKTTWADAHSAGVLRYLAALTGTELPVGVVAAPLVDTYLFQQHLDAFLAFVSERSGVPFRSFTADAYPIKRGTKSASFKRRESLWTCRSGRTPISERGASSIGSFVPSSYLKTTLSPGQLDMATRLALIEDSLTRRRRWRGERRSERAFWPLPRL